MKEMVSSCETFGTLRGVLSQKLRNGDSFIGICWL